MWPFLSYANLTGLLRHSNKVLERICSYVCHGPRSISGWVVLAHKRHRMSIYSTASFKFPGSSSSPFSAFHILLSHCHSTAFHFISGWRLASMYWTSAACQALYTVLKILRWEGQTLIAEFPFEWGDEPRTAALILPWISSSLVFPADFRLVSPWSCVSQFLKISLLICVYTYIIHTRIIHTYIHTYEHTHSCYWFCFSGESGLIQCSTDAVVVSEEEEPVLPARCSV